MIFLSKKGTDEYINLMANGLNAKPTSTEDFNYNENLDPIVLRGILKKRIMKVFKEYGLDGKEFSVFLQKQSYRDYLNLNCIADIFLDHPGWSGGITTIEAIGCNLPIVTWPGEFMRSRHSFAFLLKMNITDTIATDLNNFIEIAVRLGIDKNWRQNKRHLLT